MQICVGLHMSITIVHLIKLQLQPENLSYIFLFKKKFMLNVIIEQNVIEST